MRDTIEITAVVIQWEDEGCSAPDDGPSMTIVGWSHRPDQIEGMKEVAAMGCDLKYATAIRVVTLEIPVVPETIEVTATVIEGGENERT